MIKLLMNGIPQEQWKFWGRNNKERAVCILMNYYNPHLLRKGLLLLALVVPVVIIYKWYSPFTLALTIAWYTLIVELFLRRIIICKRF